MIGLQLQHQFWRISFFSICGLPQNLDFKFIEFLLTPIKHHTFCGCYFLSVPNFESRTGWILESRTLRCTTTTMRRNCELKKKRTSMQKSIFIGLMATTPSKGNIFHGQVVFCWLLLLWNGPLLGDMLFSVHPVTPIWWYNMFNHISFHQCFNHISFNHHTWLEFCLPAFLSHPS